MRVFIIWGGYGLHRPQETADRLAEALEKRGHAVTSTSNFGVILTEDMKRYDAIVPIWSCGIRGDAYARTLVKAVEDGLGLACFHGGIDWFDQREYHQLIGSLYLSDSYCESYRVHMHDPGRGHFAGLNDFQGSGEVYHCMFDPDNQVLATIEAGGIVCPYAWTRRHGKGKVFYSMGAHDLDDLFREGCMDLILRGIEWSAREDAT